MAQRKILNDTDQKAFDTMLGFNRYLAESPLTAIHAELIKIRVSQLNGCSFCIDKHTKEAIAAGENYRRIVLLPVWRETTLFSEEEQAILALAEEMTHISEHGVSDEVYGRALALLGQSYFTAVMMGIISMNAWNRLGITTGRKPL